MLINLKPEAFLPEVLDPRWPQDCEKDEVDASLSLEMESVPADGGYTAHVKLPQVSECRWLSEKKAGETAVSAAVFTERDRHE